MGSCVYIHVVLFILTGLALVFLIACNFHYMVHKVMLRSFAIMYICIFVPKSPCVTNSPTFPHGAHATHPTETVYQRMMNLISSNYHE